MNTVDSFSDSAAADALQRGTRSARPWTRHLLRGAVFMVLLCVGIAALLAVMKGDGFGKNLAYSVCIGVCCWLIIDVGRVAAANGIDYLRASQGRAPLPHPGFPGWGWMVSLVLLGMAVGPVAGTMLADWVLGNTTHRMLDLSATSTRVTLLLTVLASIVSVVSLSTLERLSSARATAEAAQRAAAENQLRLLESQLEPHMLFNTLANLRVLIAMDPPRAQLMLDRLIGFLRATLGASRVALHPLEAEFARLGDYLGLMQVRMDHRLETHFELPAELAACQVPPLLLQPLVENAIKHGLEPKVEGGQVTVSAAREGAQLVLRVRDTGLGLDSRTSTPATRGGFGLSQVRARLAALYGDSASLDLSDAADGSGGTLATVRLPVRD